MPIEETQEGKIFFQLFLVLRIFSFQDEINVKSRVVTVFLLASFTMLKTQSAADSDEGL